MKTNKILDKLSKIHNGSFARLTYTSDVELLARYRRMGLSIEKVVETTTRFGIHYNRIKAVNDFRSEAPNHTMSARPAWWHWDVDTKIAKHNTNGSEYLALYPLPKGSHTKVSYRIKGGSAVTYDYVKSIAVPSSFNSGSEPSIRFVKAENVIDIKNKNV